METPKKWFCTLLLYMLLLFINRKPQDIYSGLWTQYSILSQWGVMDLSEYVL